MYLFNEAETLADSPAPEPVTRDVNGYTRTDTKTKRAEIIKDLPAREVLCEIPKDNQYYLQCVSDLKPIGKETVREELEYIPAKLRIVRYVRMAYECPKCKHTDKPYIEKAPTPTSLMNHSLASPSSDANVMYQKYVNSMPLYRQEKDWENLGIALKRNTMAYWIIHCSQDFCVGRKNWLFADTPKGAEASAAVYSIVETAKANNLNVYTYLQYLLLYMPNTDYYNHSEDLEQLMP